ncbi:NAD(P)(+) transhydrogenase (Re/Si-specific) subunit beta [Sporichthya sp.]|uniref:NAD(P)(+) transhydrogenase (Re/Si-specific) subunit beta n=1 Tax=Sporichthya sp. TaxID=65475 RepID=UPI001852B6DE|nr:NAD(P)(+) transhydrogenase (Re/Si-specific) subunit beta [Sporichthya sp.]MBA3743745.1 NAD(P)(+) transhydrogenase (Re/Si-specific) subunit beta [Sporichthya sp.]
MTPEEIPTRLAAARRVVIVPGYGVAMSQTQHDLARLADTVRRRGAEVTFAVHPVAGRVPGHLDVLLDAAGVPWSSRRDLDTAAFDAGSVALVVGANDVVNPALAMPVLEVARGGAVVVFIDSTGPGYAGVVNPLFAAASVLLGDAGDLLREAEEAIARIP